MPELLKVFAELELDFAFAELDFPLVELLDRSLIGVEDDEVALVEDDDLSFWELELELINVKQGYTKCNCVVVDGHSIITSDQGIIGTLKKYPDIDVLPICQGFVSLDGFEYGFLGGASGRVGDEIIFNGDLSAHPDYDSIGRFIASRHLQLKFFPEYPLTDVGSILTR